MLLGVRSSGSRRSYSSFAVFHEVGQCLRHLGDQYFLPATIGRSQLGYGAVVPPVRLHVIVGRGGRYVKLAQLEGHVGVLAAECN